MLVWITLKLQAQPTMSNKLQFNATATWAQKRVEKKAEPKHNEQRKGKEKAAKGERKETRKGG